MEYSNDGVPWHHGVLLRRLREAVWIVVTPEWRCADRGSQHLQFPAANTCWSHLAAGHRHTPLCRRNRHRAGRITRPGCTPGSDHGSCCWSRGCSTRQGFGQEDATDLVFEPNHKSRADPLALFAAASRRGGSSASGRALRLSIRDKPVFSKDLLPLEAFVILTSGLLKQHRLLDKLAGRALVVSYGFFTRPQKH